MKSKYLHVGQAWWPALAVAAGIFLLSSIPGRDIPSSGIPHADKLVHLGCYLALGAACVRGLARSGSKRERRSGLWLWLVGAAMAIAYGASDELHQLLVPGRSPDAGDLLADAVGALIGGRRAATHALRARLPARLSD